MNLTRASSERSSRVHSGPEQGPSSRTPNERTPLLINKSQTSYFPMSSCSSKEPPAISCRASQAPIPRPGMRGVTAMTSAAATKPQLLHAVPILSRPIITRSAATDTTDTYPRFNNTTRATTAKPARPSLLHRASDIVQTTLELNQKTNHVNAPTAPSHWTDHAHRKALLKVWDAVRAVATEPKTRQPLAAQLVSTEKQMLEEFCELGEGRRPLSQEWIEYVLGVNLRHPFCTAEKMSRWEVLSASSGARGNWGPW